MFTHLGLSALLHLQELGFHASDVILRRPDQGTASGIIVFENAYFELIWVEDEGAAARYGAETGMDILARSRSRYPEISPFGLALRPRVEPRVEFPVELYSAAYAPHGLFDDEPLAHLENLTRLDEPLCLLVPDALALTTWLDEACDAHQEHLAHDLGVKRLTNVKITTSTYHSLADTVSILCREGIMAIEPNTWPLLELTFDEGARGRVIDARAILPIVFRY